MVRRVAFVLVLLAAGLPLFLPVRAEERAASRIVERAQAWLARLPARQRGAVLRAFEAPERGDWHYVPRARTGLALRSMDDGARREVLVLFASVLGPERWRKAEAVFVLEEVLRRQAVAANPNVPSSWRDPLLYFVTVFGAPREDAAWGLRLEGHHLSINLTLVGSVLRAATPLFFGANPASVRTADGGVLRPLGAEEDLALRLVTGLDVAQRREAVVSSRVPGDVLFGPSRAATATGQGVPASALAPAQRTLLRALVDAHRLAAPVAESELEAARFVWRGGTRAGGDLYYRIEAPTFLIELRDLGSHVHALWRDPRGDFPGR